MSEGGSESTGIENRKSRGHPRAKCDWKVRVITPQKKRFMARAKNISVGGVLVEIPEKFSVGEHLYLEIQAFFLGKQKLIKVVGSVKYVVFQSGSFNLGLQFATDTKEFAAFLKEYVHKKTE